MPAIYCETAQEVLDNILIAFKLAEKVLLPAMVCMDGFLLSHYSEPVDVPDQQSVDRFLPPRKAQYRMDPNDPYTFGRGVSGQVLYELRQRMQEDMDQVPVQPWADLPWLIRGIGALAASTLVWLVVLLPDQVRMARLDWGDSGRLRALFRRWSLVGWSTTVLLYVAIWYMVTKS